MLDKLKIVSVGQLVQSNVVNIDLNNQLIETNQVVVMFVDHHHNKLHHQLMVNSNQNFQFLMLFISKQINRNKLLKSTYVFYPQ
jgi:hypothetical protein